MKSIGILLDGSTLKLASIQKKGRSLDVLRLQSHPLEQLNVKQLDIHGFSNRLASGLPGGDLIIQSLPFRSKIKEDLRQALALQAETALHLDPEETLTSLHIEKQEKRAIAYSTTKTALETHLKSFAKIGLDPELVGAVPIGLLSLIRWKAPELRSFFLIDIGLGSTTCIWAEDGILQRAHGIPLGIEQIKMPFAEDRKKSLVGRERREIDFSSLKPGLFPNLSEERFALRRDLEKILHSFQCRRPLIFTGEFALGGELREFLFETLCEFVSEEKRPLLSLEEIRYASCLGLALDPLTACDRPVQFRKSPSLPFKTWDRLGRLTSGFLAASAVLSAGFYAAGSSFIQSREQEVVRNLETWTASKDPALREELFSGDQNSQELVRRWLALVEKNTREYPFIPKAPRVIQCLEWLSSHPLLESFAAGNDPISFEKINYRLVSFPRLEAMKDPYLVKLELEFKVSSPLHARKFHEMLLQSPQIVDASKELTWDVQQDCYRTTFYLCNEAYGSF